MNLKKNQPMKRVTLALLLLCSITTFAQDGINYKALIKDNLGTTVASQSIDVRFTIIADAGPTTVYSEEHTGVLTDANGILILSIGGGTTTDVFADIAWGSDTHSLKVEVDIERDGTFVDMGTTQFMSVPYALHARTAENVDDADSDPTNEIELQPLGTEGQVLTMVSGVPTWGTPSYGLSIGDTYQGGIIFHLDSSGLHGLVAAVIDQSAGAEWDYCGTGIAGADGTEIGTGSQNTIDIVTDCVSPGAAADICANLVLAGFSDWFLPSRNELLLMFMNIGQGDAYGLGNVGGFAQGLYWCSTETAAPGAWGMEFSNSAQSFVGMSGQISKATMANVRAVRAF
jgi:hypothetical protein